MGGQNGVSNGRHHHIHPPTYPPKINTAMAAPITAVVKRNTLAALGEPAEMLKQTLQSAPNSRPGSRSSSRRRQPPTTPTPKHGHHSIFTPNGSVEGSDGGASPRTEEGGIDFHRMRHGFEDEYNSEDYLAVLEQVCTRSSDGVKVHIHRLTA